MKRYPGIRPFTAVDAPLFYGRDEEKRDLSQMAILNAVVVLLGKSGTGKSSLLNAGVCPQLQDRNLHPVFIRLNNTDRTPDQQVYEFLQEHDYIPKDMPAGLTLWEYFKRFWYVDLGEVFTPVIILDQFEELFTLYTPEERKNFIDQFADMVNGRMPASLQQKIKDPGADLDKEIDWATSPNVKFILSIRSDYLYLLNELSADIPSILRTRFQLNMLNRSNAIQAITLPAMADGSFESPVFQYEEAALHEIIEVLGKKETDQLRNDLPDSEIEIEAFQLQLFCQQIENKIIAEKKPEGFKVTSAFFGGKAGIQKIIGEFYTGVISRVPKEYQVAVETMVATYLIRNKRRIIMEESAIREECGIPQNLLDQLHEERLLRKEARSGSFYYEISHDTLLEPVLEKYQHIATRLEEERQEQERLAKEKELAAIKQNAEEERQRAEEQSQLRATAEKNEQHAKQRTRLATVVSAVALVLMVLLFGLWRNVQSISAEKQGYLAEIEKTLEHLEVEKTATLAAKETAELRRIEADTSAAIAKREKEKAKKETLRADEQKQLAVVAKNQAQSALSGLKSSNKTVALLILQNAEKDIYNLDYEAALEKIKATASLDALPKECSNALLEIAFWHGETGNTPRAKGILDSAAALVNKTVASRQPLREAIKALDKDVYKKLMERYYPIMVTVEGGTFDMGEEDINSHKQEVSSFQIAKYETTWWQYLLFCEVTGHEFQSPGWGRDGDNPVVNVSWFDAILYLNWMSKQFGLDTFYIVENKSKRHHSDNPKLYHDYYDVSFDKNQTVNGFRLPTEAEWEYAAKGGKPGADSITIYSGSNNVDSVAWHFDNSKERTHPVGFKKANPLDLYDMSGNVSEWCWDWHSDYLDAPPLNYAGPSVGDWDESRESRGGSWKHNQSDNPSYLRCTFRDKFVPDNRREYFGFRLARAAP